MIKYHEAKDNIIIAELDDENLKIADTQEALDLIGDIGSNDCSRIIIYRKNLHDDFFNLKTRVAGDILQKFSNYRIQMAVVGDFTNIESNSFHDFVRECNRGKMTFFLSDFDSAFKRLAGQ